MSLYRLTVKDNMYCSGGIIPKGATVDVPEHNGGCGFDVQDAREVFYRIYGLRPSIQDVQSCCNRVEIK